MAATNTLSIREQVSQQIGASYSYDLPLLRDTMRDHKSRGFWLGVFDLPAGTPQDLYDKVVNNSQTAITACKFLPFMVHYASGVAKLALTRPLAVNEKSSHRIDQHKELAAHLQGKVNAYYVSMRRVFMTDLTTVSALDEEYRLGFNTERMVVPTQTVFRKTETNRTTTHVSEKTTDVYTYVTPLTHVFDRDPESGKYGLKRNILSLSPVHASQQIIDGRSVSLVLSWNLATATAPTNKKDTV